MIGISKDDVRAIIDAVYLASPLTQINRSEESLQYDLEFLENLTDSFLTGTVPVKTLLVKTEDVFEVTFHWETEYGEPQAIIYLKDRTMLEITFESYGLEPKDRYYSARLHCSERDFENGMYHNTMGVIESRCGRLSDISSFVTRICREREIDGINKVEKLILPSRTLAHLEDRFEATLHKAMHELLCGCICSAGLESDVDFEKIEEESYGYGIHNDIKEHVYKLFCYLGYDIRSDGTCF